MTRDGIDRRMLGVYLNDHLAGAAGGRELAKRAAGSHQFGGTVLARLADDIAADERELLELTRSLGITIRSYKRRSAWLVEKAARIKPNGRVLRRSPLSDLVELEALALGVEGKAALWRTLSTIAEQVTTLDGDRLQILRQRAAQQLATVEELRASAVPRAFLSTPRQPTVPPT